MMNDSYFDHILKVEGGWSDHPNDPGGATMMGITKRVYEAWLGRSVTKAELRNISKEEVLAIYQARYWDVNRTDHIESEFVRLALFDQSVNRGYRTAARMLQRTCNQYGKNLAVDGIVGNMTLAAVNDIDPEELGMDFVQRAQHGYLDLAQRRSSLRVFLKGWINRTHVLLDEYAGFVGEFEGEMAKAPDPDEPEGPELDLFERIVAHNPKINRRGLTKALQFYDDPRVTRKEYMTFVDFDMRSSERRMWVIRMSTGKAVHQLKVAHGRHSDPNNDGYADRYSNVRGSGQSSLGAMVVGEKYGHGEGGWSKFPVATKIRGLEPGLNDNVFRRAVVFHSSKYVNQFNDAVSGRSLGCFAVDDDVAKDVESYIHGGTLLYAWDKDFITA